MAITPTVKINSVSCCCGGTGVDPITCDRCCVCTDGEQQYFHEYFWLEIAGVLPNPYFKGVGCPGGCDDLNGKHKLILRRYADFPDCPFVQVAHDFDLPWCVYTTDEPAPATVSVHDCDPERLGDCMADVPNWGGCTPSGNVPRWTLLCAGGQIEIVAPWGPCGAIGGAGLEVRYPIGEIVEPFCMGVHGNDATCDPTPGKDCTLNRVYPSVGTGFYTQCLFGPNLDADDGKSPVGLPPSDGPWSAKLTPGGAKIPCGEVTTKAFAMSAPMAVPKTARIGLQIRAVPCIHLGKRTEFRTGCGGWTCRHECDHTDHEVAVPGGLCQTCPDYEAEQDISPAR